MQNVYKRISYFATYNDNIFYFTYAIMTEVQDLNKEYFNNISNLAAVI